MQLFTHCNALEQMSKQDYVILSSRFREVIKQRIPVFSDLLFVGREDTLAAFSLPAGVKKTIEEFFTKSGEGKTFISSIEQTILFSLPTENDEVVVVVTEVDEYFCERVSSDWLEEFCQHVHNSFILIKKANTDLETCLPNNQCFLGNLQEAVLGSSSSLLLVEAYPRARSAHEAQLHKAKVSRALASCLNRRIPFYYLGNHIYGLLSTVIEKNDFHAIGKRILTWLRREGFRKVHVGVCYGEDHGSTDEKHEAHHTLYEQGLFALKAARKRGPFALCDYHHLSKPDEHPLRRPSTALLARFKRRWRNVDSFSVVELQPAENKDIPKIIEVLPEEYMVATEKKSIYLFFPDTPAEQAQRIIGSWLTKEKLDNILTGVAYYPHLSFSRSDTIFNCRKAINHAAFYGPNGSAIFDEVSLNVSGDIYYAEGDLNLAVQEYRTGIACDPKNVNLLNSLGVAYADMAKHRDAQCCFAKVLEIEKDNFMALYNAGLEADVTGNSAAALDFFIRANNTLQTDQEIAADLTYHCGRSLCLEGRYQEAIGLLLPWFQDDPESKTKERALPYLGRSFYGLQKYAKAAEWLQRALQYNEFDGESMGLLGLCYLILGEGNTIALSLCQKSVDLEPDDKMLRIYLARVQIACKLHEKARVNLSKCLRSKQTKTEAQVLSALNYLEQGMEGRAQLWLAKIPTGYHVPTNIAERMEELMA